MNVDLTRQDLDTLIESLEYSEMRVRDAQGAPHEVRQENLARLDSVAAKVRAARKQ